jgi:hypothetical protein
VFLAPDQQRASEVTDAARVLMALRNVDNDKATKKQLSDDQLKDLAQRLKEAEARLPSALMTAYRIVLVPAEKKTLRVFDMGMSKFSGPSTLSSKVLEKLIDEQILKGLDPKILIGERFALWPEDQEMVNVRTLADYFTQLTHLPRLLGPDVLPACLAQGVHRGLFGYALGDGERKRFDTIYYRDKSVAPTDCQVIESAWLLRPKLAEALMPKPEPVTVPTTGGGGAGGGGVSTPGVGEGGGPAAGEGEEPWTPTGGGGVQIVEGERRLNKVRIDMKNLPWENWNDIYNEVIDPLAQEGADVRCDVVVIAKGDAAIRENTVELGIKESLSQRGIDAQIQTG